MDHLRMVCDGITVGSLRVPPFQLGGGDLLCLHLPCPAFSREEKQVAHALTGKRPLPGLRISGRVTLAFPPVVRAGLLGLFHRPLAVDWLRRASGISDLEAGAILLRLGIRAGARVGELPGTPRTLLGLEAAWAGAADALVFLTAGLDPLGRRAVFEAVATHVSRCPAVHLSHAYTTQGRWERSCPPGASCIEATWLPGTARSLSPAEG